MLILTGIIPINGEIKLAWTPEGSPYFQDEGQKYSVVGKWKIRQEKRESRQEK